MLVGKTIHSGRKGGDGGFLFWKKKEKEGDQGTAGGAVRRKGVGCSGGKPPFFPPLQLSPADERSNSLLLLWEKLRENKWKEELEEEGRGKNKEGEMKRGLPAEKNGRAGER